jgi:type IV pilus assembly protein PilM
MARSDAVWGIDIGQCSLKALRCVRHDQSDRLVAEAFDYIEYPKILSQPGADPAELVGDALKQFLSRNSVRGDRVALAVAGQSGLARFIKLPPVESKKIPDIVRYEARQQIPFDLADVVWDYQRMGGGSEEEGFSLETEIGLFAMKREQVFRALEPLRNAGIEVDLVQLAPLAIYNYLVFDQMNDLPPADEYDPENPPPSVVVLSLGTDATDLIVTNGYRVWQRSIPLGGSHFTKALTKELKLTFAKAEHLKRNATAAQDPKAVFQAMKTVFNDLLTEIQRSLGYFSSLNRKAKLGKVVALGNAMKLPGLRKYLSQGLGMEVTRLDTFRGLSGSQVLGAPAFKENQLSFGVCYGLAAQGLGKALVTTNLLPQEIVKDRLVREKKPWAVAAAAALMLACTISFASWTRAVSTVDQKTWNSAENDAVRVKKKADDFKSEMEKGKTAFAATDQIGVHLMGNVEGRILWLEMLRAINECLPNEARAKPAEAAAGQKPEDASQRKEEDPAQRKVLYIQNIEAQKVDRVEDWYAIVTSRGWYTPPGVTPGAPGTGADPAAAPPAGAPGAPAAPGLGTPAPMTPPAVPAPAATPPAAVPAPAPLAGPSPVAGPGAFGAPAPGMQGAAAAGAAAPPPGGPAGPGWIIRLTGYHFHNFDTPDPKFGAMAGKFVHETLIENLRTKKILLPAAPSAEAPASGKQKLELVSMEELGIRCPTLVDPKGVVQRQIPDPNAAVEEDPTKPKTPAVKAVGPGVHGELEKTVKMITLRQYPFAVEFVWQPVTPTKRAEAKQKELAEKAQQEAAAKP